MMLTPIFMQTNYPNVHKTNTVKNNSVYFTGIKDLFEVTEREAHVAAARLAAKLEDAKGERAPKSQGAPRVVGVRSEVDGNHRLFYNGKLPGDVGGKNALSNAKGLTSQVRISREGGVDGFSIAAAVRRRTGSREWGPWEELRDVGY